MLKGKALGRAIEEARLKKKVSKRALAAHFGVKPPSVSDWVARGTISKDKLPRLWEYFSDVVGSDHWGLARFPGDQGEPPRRHATVGPRNAPAAETAIALTAAEPPPSSLIYASPPELSWSQLQAMPAHTLPRRFRLAAADDALAPVTPRGTIAKHVSRTLDYLALGGLGSEEWKHGSFGTKIERAMQFKATGVPIIVVHEDPFAAALMQR